MMSADDRTQVLEHPFRALTLPRPEGLIIAGLEKVPVRR
jgi:hypothetical protein